MPEVSVIIPTYNRDHIVSRAVKIALSQSFRDIEVIIIDDGSTDNTVSVIASIKDPRIKYFRQEHRGLSAACNHGQRNAVGNYIANLDSDDVWPENYLESAIECFRQNPQVGLVYCRTLCRDDGEHLCYEDKEANCYSGHVTARYFKKPFIWPSAAVVIRQVVTDIFHDESLTRMTDWDFFLKVLIRTEVFFNKQVMVVRYMSTDSMCHSKDIDCSGIRVLERFYHCPDTRKYVPALLARQRIAKVSNSIARRCYKASYKKTAIYFYKKAITYCPWEIKYYRGLIKSLCIPSSIDKLAAWKMPDRIKF
jgi:glycosyltransferase involved in cell wall biosynthesis